MTLAELGYTSNLNDIQSENGWTSFLVGRVAEEHKERYHLFSPEGEYDAEILGNLRYTAQSRADFPAVGDWVAFTPYDENKALIHGVFPRKSTLQRQAIGSLGEIQIIATNIDVAFIVQSLDRDISINRIERYATICNSSKVKPVVVLTKSDTIAAEDIKNYIQQISDRLKDTAVYSISNISKEGIEALSIELKPQKTYCLLGSSGVGKSSLLNVLAGNNEMKTGSISEHSNRGKHVTTHRELKLLPNGSIIIDNPGMREVGMTSDSSGLEVTFDFIHDLSASCKYSDCTHTVETGCAVLAAVESGEIDAASYENYQKLEREKDHFESSVAERRKKDKDFGKMVKSFKKIKNNKRL